jgi:hypothetical protein
MERNRLEFKSVMHRLVAMKAALAGMDIETKCQVFCYVARTSGWTVRQLDAAVRNHADTKFIRAAEQAARQNRTTRQDMPSVRVA